MSLFEKMRKDGHPSLSLKPRHSLPSMILEDHKKGIKREKQKMITDFFKDFKNLI